MRTISKQTGFTIIELLVAITILAIVVMGIGALFAAGMRASTQIRLHSRATSLAEATIEELERLPRTAAELSAGNHGPEIIDGVFARSWNVMVDSPIPGMRSVALNVSFRNIARSDSTRVSLTMYLRPR